MAMFFASQFPREIRIAAATGGPLPCRKWPAIPLPHNKRGAGQIHGLLADNGKIKAAFFSVDLPVHPKEKHGED